MRRRPAAVGLHADHADPAPPLGEQVLARLARLARRGDVVDGDVVSACGRTHPLAEEHERQRAVAGADGPVVEAERAHDHPVEQTGAGRVDHPALAAGVPPVGSTSTVQPRGRAADTTHWATSAKCGSLSVGTARATMPVRPVRRLRADRFGW